MSDFQGKHFLVVGAYSGIGLAAAQRLAREGATIVGVGRSREKLAAALATLAGSGHEALVAAAAVWEQLQGAVPIGRKLGGYAGLLVSAGLHEVRPLSVLDSESLHRSFEANVNTAILATRALSKASRKKGASVVWLSSIAALRGTATFTAYAAAKGALISAARAIAVELASRHIRINVIAAGVVRTAMSRAWLSHLNEEQLAAVEKDHPLGLGTPDQVAGVIRFLLSEDSAWMTGSVLTVDGGLAAK